MTSLRYRAWSETVPHVRTGFEGLLIYLLDPDGELGRACSVARLALEQDSLASRSRNDARELPMRQSPYRQSRGRFPFWLGGAGRSTLSAHTAFTVATGRLQGQGAAF